jgi:hypothetical protein
MKSFKTYVENSTIPKALEYHIINDIPLAHNVFRAHTPNYYALFEYARQNVDSLDTLSEFDRMLMESDIGQLATYEGIEVPLDHPLIEEDDKDIELNSPKRGGAKKFYVYVKNEKGNIIKVQFGDTTGLTAKIDDPAARKSFAARHNCDQKKDKTTPGYWSCRLPYYAKELGLKGGGNFFW